MMYIWKVDSLINDLRARKVSQKDQLKYLMFWCVITISCTDPWIWVGHAYRSMDTLYTVVALIIEVVVLCMCYRNNGREDGHDLLLRYSALSVPIVIRHVIWLVPLILAATPLVSLFANILQVRFSILILDYVPPFVTCFWVAFVGWRIFVCVGKCAEKNSVQVNGS